ncbi:unnamed protein product [Toxocara canis]|uniref:Uncharacterized protein n=1 Tax=Toxocara canis TaxID=6265 RepID=A0A3P7EZ49_TOXCA|nr:unnamed protein product [Toxocara canis]
MRVRIGYMRERLYSRSMALRKYGTTKNGSKVFFSYGMMRSSVLVKPALNHTCSMFHEVSAGKVKGWGKGMGGLRWRRDAVDFESWQILEGGATEKEQSDAII